MGSRTRKGILAALVILCASTCANSSLAIEWPWTQKGTPETALRNLRLALSGMDYRKVSMYLDKEDIRQRGAEFAIDVFDRGIDSRAWSYKPVPNSKREEYRIYVKHYAYKVMTKAMECLTSYPISVSRAKSGEAVAVFRAIGLPRQVHRVMFTLVPKNETNWLVDSIAYSTMSSLFPGSDEVAQDAASFISKFSPSELAAIRGDLTRSAAPAARYRKH